MGLCRLDVNIAESGGVLFDPVSGQEKLSGPGPPMALVKTLMERGVEPIFAGRTVIATWQPHEAAALASFAELGLDSQSVFNKGAVMVLPAGVTKARGLAARVRRILPYLSGPSKGRGRAGCCL